MDLEEANQHLWMWSQPFFLWKLRLGSEKLGWLFLAGLSSLACIYEEDQRASPKVKPLKGASLG
jgi:hypothetical protein